MFVQSVDEATVPETAEGDIPQSDSTYSIDIPNSFTIWQANPRPPHSKDVSY